MTVQGLRQEFSSTRGGFCDKMVVRLTNPWCHPSPADDVHLMQSLVAVARQPGVWIRELVTLEPFNCNQKAQPRSKGSRWYGFRFAWPVMHRLD